jgi:hypothetical protein
MAKGKKICKICGCEYEACHTQRPYSNGEFRWQDVACCPEHGQEYLRKVLIARGELREDPAVQPEKKAEEPVKQPEPEQTVEAQPAAPKTTKRKRKASAAKAE